VRLFRGILLLPIALAVSCATSPPPGPPAPALAEARLAEVRQLISSGSVLQGYQELSVLRRDTPQNIQASDLEALEGQAASALTSAFAKAVADKSWDDALRYLRSALVLGRPDVPGEWTEKAILDARAAGFESSGDELLSLMARMRALSAGEPTEAELSAALQKASSLGNRALARSLADLLKKRGFAVPASAAGAGGTPSFADMIEGTVTIWVNRGIRIEKGVGYPDRVIGSGFFIDTRGYLLTNYHVIKSEVDPAYEGYSRLFIRFNESTGERIPAKVIGYDTVFDLALLKPRLHRATPSRGMEPSARARATGSSPSARRQAWRRPSRRASSPRRADGSCRWATRSRSTCRSTPATAGDRSSTSPAA
jgi:serine protease Do